MPPQRACVTLAFKARSCSPAPNRKPRMGDRTCPKASCLGRCPAMAWVCALAASIASLVSSSCWERGSPKIDLEHREVVLESGRRAAWDLLCIATGSSARRLAGFDDASYLRELPDAELLRQVLEGGGRLQVVGAGFIGCEVAAAARRRGCAVTMF